MSFRWYLDGIEKTKEEVEDEVIEAAEEARKKASLLRKLRKLDHVTKRTCASCLHRKLKATDFYQDTDEICIECREK